MTNASVPRIVPNVDESEPDRPFWKKRGVWAGAAILMVCATYTFISSRQRSRERSAISINMLRERNTERPAISAIVMEYLEPDDLFFSGRIRTALQQVFSGNIHQFYEETEATQIHKWVVDDIETTVIPRDDRLYCETVNYKAGPRKITPLSLQRRTIEENMNDLTQCVANIENTGRLKFFSMQVEEVLRVMPTSSRRVEACLLLRSDNLFWRVFEKTGAMKVTFLIPFTNYCFAESDIYADTTVKIIKTLGKVNWTLPLSETLKNALLLAQSFQVHGVQSKKINEQSLVESPDLVELVPIGSASRIDNRFVLSEFMWGVTLICNGGFRDNHAQIIIEGLENGVYFMKLAHLHIGDDGKEEVEFRLLDSNALKYVERTEVWKIPRTKAQEMFVSIQADERSPPKLDRWGRDSLFVKEGTDSCFTWAREKLKICDIDLGKSSIGFLFTITKNYTKPDESHKQNKQLTTSHNKI